MFIAAERREFDGLLRLCSAVERLRWPVDWARYGELRGYRVWMAANGAGAERAARATEAGLVKAAPEAVVSLGFCGALDPALAVGDIFAGTEVRSASGRIEAQKPDCPRRFTSGPLLTHHRIAATAAEKSRLWTTGVSAVEMEAAGVGERALAWGVPFFCIRAVTDLAGESFALDFNSALRADGHFDTMHILRALLRRPSVSLPELVRLRNRCRQAAFNLGEFIADSRF